MTHLDIAVLLLSTPLITALLTVAFKRNCGWFGAGYWAGLRIMFIAGMTGYLLRNLGVIQL